MHTAELAITQQMIDNYGSVNGDFDILHYDAEYAAKRGFRGTLAHGLMIQGFANTVAIDAYGAEWFTRGEIAVKFIGPMVPGDTVVVTLDDSGDLVAKVGSTVTMVGTATLRDAAQ